MVVVVVVAVGVVVCNSNWERRGQEEVKVKTRFKERRGEGAMSLHSDFLLTINVHCASAV